MYRLTFITLASLLLAVPAFAQNRYTPTPLVQHEREHVVDQHPRVFTVTPSPLVQHELVYAKPLPSVSNLLEETAVKIMRKAFRIGDYETVEMLFEKLSLENKVKFLCEATEIADVFVSIMVDMDAKVLEATKATVDSAFLLIGYVLSQENKVEEIALAFENYVQEKSRQTQLLGRLTASLLEQPKTATVVAPVR